MLKPSDPRDLAVDLIPRSICLVGVGAAVTDAGGSIISWGWNQVHTGRGLCAERHAISRANRSRLWAGFVYVAGKYRNGNLVNAKPCEKCMEMIRKYEMSVYWRDKQGQWIYIL